MFKLMAKIPYGQSVSISTVPCEINKVDTLITFPEGSEISRFPSGEYTGCHGHCTRFPSYYGVDPVSLSYQNAMMRTMTIPGQNIGNDAPMPSYSDCMKTMLMHNNVEIGRLLKFNFAGNWLYAVITDINDDGEIQVISVDSIPYEHSLDPATSKQSVMAKIDSLVRANLMTDYIGIVVKDVGVPKVTDIFGDPEHPLSHTPMSVDALRKSRELGTNRVVPYAVSNDDLPEGFMLVTKIGDLSLLLHDDQLVDNSKLGFRIKLTLEPCSMIERYIVYDMNEIKIALHI